MNGLKIMGECDGCHNFEEIVNVSNELKFCENCMIGIDSTSWHTPIIKI